MKKELILEISRIHEIMGVNNKRILNEISALPGDELIERGAKTFWKNMKRLFGGAEASVETMTERGLENMIRKMETELGDTVIIDLKHILENPSLVTTLEKEEAMIEKLKQSVSLQGELDTVIKSKGFEVEKLNELYDSFLQDPDVLNTLNFRYLELLEGGMSESEARNTLSAYYSDKINPGRINRYLATHIPKMEPNGEWMIYKWNPPSNNLVKPLSLLPTENLKDFQTWMDNKHNGWYKGGKIQETTNPSQHGHFNKETMEAWETHKAEFYDSLNITKKLKFAEFQSIVEQDITKWDKFWNNRKILLQNVTTFVRGFFEKNYKQGTEELTQAFDEFLGKLKVEVNNVTQNTMRDPYFANKVNFQTIANDFTDLAKTQVGTSKEELYKGIEDMLKSQAGVSEDNIKFIIKMLKESDVNLKIKVPLSGKDGVQIKNKKGEPMFSTKKTYVSPWARFLDEGTWGMYKRKSAELDTLTKKAYEILRRIFNEGVLGTFKTFRGPNSDWEQYVARFGGNKNKARLAMYADLQLVAKVGMPLVVGAYKAILNFKQHQMGEETKTFDNPYLEVPYYIFLESLRHVSGNLTKNGVAGAIGYILLPIDIPTTWFPRYIVDTYAGKHDGDAKEILDAGKREFKKLLDKWDKLNIVDKEGPVGFVIWLEMYSQDKKKNLTVFGRGTVESDWWTEKTNSINGKPFGTDNEKTNWQYSIPDDGYVVCSDCAKKEEPAPPTPTDTTTTTEPVTPEPVTSAGLTVDSIIEKYPCYLKNNKGQQSSDKNFGDRGFEIVNDKQFKYKFINDTEIYTVNLGEDGVWKFEDGTALSC